MSLHLLCLKSTTWRKCTEGTNVYTGITETENRHHPRLPFPRENVRPSNFGEIQKRTTMINEEMKFCYTGSRKHSQRAT